MYFKIRPISRQRWFSWWWLFLFISIGLFGSTIYCRRQQSQPKFENNANFINSEEIEEFDDFDCPEKFGYYADSQNCSRYHICDHGKATLKSCDDGLVFSTILKTCDWPYNVHCNLANGDRGDFTGRHLRLRANSPHLEENNNNDGNNIDFTLNNRRQPVLTNEADDSYWLDRPNPDLLAYLHDEYYHDVDHEEITDFDIPRRKSANPQPQSNHHEEPANHTDDDGDDEEPSHQPWPQDVNFEHIRRPNQNKHRHTTTTTAAPISTNQRGNIRWRTRTHPIISTSTTYKPPATPARHQVSMLPRKALRVDSNVDGEEDDLENVSRVIPENDLNNYRRQMSNLKDDRESYRIVSHNTNKPLTTITTTRLPPPWSRPQHQLTTLAPTQQSAVTQIGSRPRHLGTSFRRKVVRKKIVQPTTTTTTTTTTSAPVTFRNPNDFWNNPWKSVRYENINRNNNNSLGPQHISSIRRTIPKIEHRRFERKPVLKDPDESEEQLERGHDENDNNYFYNTPEIVRNRSSNITRNSNDLLPKNFVKDVSNNITKERLQTVDRQPSPTITTTNQRNSQNQHLNNVFDVGFRHAINPINVHYPISSSFVAHHPPSPNLATDIEYEDLENEDEDEDVDNVYNGDEENNNSKDDGANLNNNNNHHNDNRAVNKEIIVRYDDEADDHHHSHHHHQIYPQHLNTTSRFVTSLPRVITTSNRIASHQPTTKISSRMETPSTPMRLTRFIGSSLGNNNSSNHNQPNITKPQSSAIRIVDLTLNNQPIPLHHHLSHAHHISNPLPFVTIIGPLQSNKTNNQFLPSPVVPRLSTQFAPNQLGSWIGPLPPTHGTTTKKIKSNKKQIKALENELKHRAAKKHSHFHKAKRCVPEDCQPPNCRCGGLDIPGGFKPKDIPQIVLLTFDDSVNDLNLHIYRRLFEKGRTNPNGCPISATFYVSHEWTDYSQVQNLYAKGHEIASHSISHSFGEKFSKDRWLDEIVGQKEILHLYAGVDAHEIRGMRAPFLQTGGDTMFEMLYQANFSYDSSLPVYDIDPPYWPYTLDYSIAHDCMIEPCPSNSYPGFWEVGMVMWEDLRGGRCSMADGCFNPSDEDGVYEMVKQNFLRHYTSNRAPFGMFFHSRWFLTEHNMNGFIRFLDEMLQLDDIYLVTNWQMIQWMRYPTPLSHIKKFAPFGCDYIRQRPPICKTPHTCKVRFRGEIRTLKTCQRCPQSYPWTGNNGNNNSNNNNES